MREIPANNGRRAFLKGSALVVAFSFLPKLAYAELNAMGLPKVLNKGLPGSLKSTPWLDAWIRIAADGKVTVCSGKVELGTGVRTALIQIAAEQLELMPADIMFIAGDTSLTPNEGFTAGSHTIPDSGTALLNAAAQVRALLLQGAAAKLKVSADSLWIRNGRITSAEGGSINYGAAIAGIDLHRQAAPASVLKPPSSYTLIGHPVPRVDIPGKLTGGSSYVQDIRLPGMLHARVIRPPTRDARLLSVDIAAAERLPGVLKIIRDGSYLAAVASDEWSAITAMRALTVSAKWEGGAVLPTPQTIHATLQALPSEDIVILNKGKMAMPAVRTLKSRFTKQYVMHGSIGPSCAVAHLTDGSMTVWTHTQGVFPLRSALAELLGMPDERVRCIHTEGSGCYGQNGADDVAADAVLIAKAMPGRPVRVQLMRDQENQWEPFAPAMITEIEAGLDASGRISYWHYELWSGSHNERPGNAGKLAPGWMLARPFVPSPSLPMLQPEGGGDRNALPLYVIPNAHITNHFLPRTPLRTSAMRSLGAHINILSIESTMDELSSMAALDPVEFRLRHLEDTRAQDVIRTAARQFGWEHRSRKRNRGFGFAFGQYKNLMGYVAIALELEVQPDTGKVSVVRVVAAVDCGQIVNPDGVINQIEGGIVQSTSWTLYEQLQFASNGIKSIDWASYPIMRFSQIPAKIEVHLLDRPGLPFLGVAEAAQGPMAGALANALAQATGKRLRNLPFGGPQLRS
ncbi:xanthine dehydrogenase family protein molybdopterin-binding subunit [Undibacterium terreum]|uniref:Aldehyde dehydrogenase n=1 Tax=Undibacterium terreum TaxID=1224302 RepID=A0A916U3Z4_9BURK|nr:molybdopterin cofactor-binding domain-containing protein [Undibacterium terreum]GGC57835.1 aldehyde dehydrogenase [Undibacterium terreum]